MTGDADDGPDDAGDDPVGASDDAAGPGDDPTTPAGDSGASGGSGGGGADDGTAARNAGDGTAEREPFRSELDEVRRDLADVAGDLDDLEERIDDRTVSRDDLESDLRRYVRRRLRRGHAREWGPYIVLLYGTAMTLGAFYFLSGGWAVLAMVVVWLSTLGLYVLMLLVGLGLNLVGGAGRLRDAVGSVIGAIR